MEASEDIRRKMSSENLVDFMIEDRKTWETLQEFIRKIMKTKEFLRNLVFVLGETLS